MNAYGAYGMKKLYGKEIEGVIRSTDMFKAAATLTGADRRLRAGEYLVPSKSSLRAVLKLLTDGRVVRHYVTIPEGWSSAQAVDILMKEDLLTGEAPRKR